MDNYNGLNSSRSAFRRISNGLSSFQSFTPGRDFHGDSEPRIARWNSRRTELSKRKSELYESPSSKQYFKDFTAGYKHLESSGFYSYFNAVIADLTQLPQHLHWKLYIDLADLAKRDNKINEARALFAISTHLQPHAPQSWLEHSKLEEEAGRVEMSRQLLLRGLAHCPLNDQLAVKYLKTEEKLENFAEIRRFLASIQGASVEKNWKLLLEGIMIEARCGNIQEARSMLRVLMGHCYMVGHIYLEAVKFEEKWGNDLAAALKICEKGLTKNSRYGPLWFSYMRIIEKIEYLNAQKTLVPDLTRKKQEILTKGPECISRELIWKLYVEHAFSCEQKEQFTEARKYMKEAVLKCPENLRWKVWTTGARIELRSKNSNACLKLLTQSLEEVPFKQRPIVLVELSKVYEFLGNMDKAREAMIEACDNSKQDWKVYLEYITMEMRNHNFDTALKIAKDSLVSFNCTGRLWAALIQLQHAKEECIRKQLQFKAFQVALNEVPKSGEVWCEGARVRMNPFTEFYDLEKAEKYLKYAIQFTPQYGDSFIELLRLYMLEGKFHELSNLKRLCINADPNYGMLWFYCKKDYLEGSREVWKRAKWLVKQELCLVKQLFTNRAMKDDYMAKMWSGLLQVNKVYSQGKTIDTQMRWRLIFGCDPINL